MREGRVKGIFCHFTLTPALSHRERGNFLCGHSGLGDAGIVD